MYAVRVIPEDTKILCCRLQVCEAAYGFIRVGDALRIGVLRHTPNAFDCRVVVDQFFYPIHIRSGYGHRDVDHLNSEGFGDGEVTIITRYRTQKFYFVQLAPGSMSQDTMHHGSRYRVIHDVQAGIAIDDDVVGGYACHARQQFFCFFQSVQHTVVAAIQSCNVFQVALAIQHVQHEHGQVELICAWLSSGHIQM